MVDDEFEGMHPLVELIVTRIRTHPDEFVDRDRTDSYAELGVADRSRWFTIIYEFSQIATEEEKAAVNAALHGPQMDLLREEFLDELLNGEERRRQEREKREAEMRARLANAAATFPTATSRQAGSMQQVGAYYAGLNQALHIDSATTKSAEQDTLVDLIKNTKRKKLFGVL